jgi:hypothetical protein
LRHRGKSLVAIRAGGRGVSASAWTCGVAGCMTNCERPLPSLWRSCRSTCRPRRRAGRLRMSSHPPFKRGSQHSPCAAGAPMTYELFLIGMVRAGPINLGCVLAVSACGRGRSRSAFNSRDSCARDGCRKRNTPRVRGARQFAPSLGARQPGQSRTEAGAVHACLV